MSFANNQIVIVNSLFQITIISYIRSYTKMIKQILLLTGVSALGVSCYYLWTMRKYQKLFDKVEGVTQMFNIGYLESITDLPSNKNIILAGKAQHPEKTPIILEIKGLKADHLQFIDLPFKYSLLTKNLQTLVVDNQPQTLVYNLKQLSNKPGFGISHDVNVAMVGVKRANNRFEPYIIMGQNKQSLLKSLDAKILQIRNKSRNLTIIGTLVIIGHAIYEKYESSRMPK